MTNKMFEVTYEVVGRKRNDTVTIFATDIVKAIEQFEQTEIETINTKITYNRHAIIAIN